MSTGTILFFVGLVLLLLAILSLISPRLAMRFWKIRRRKSMVPFYLLCAIAVMGVGMGIDMSTPEWQEKEAARRADRIAHLEKTAAELSGTSIQAKLDVFRELNELDEENRAYRESLQIYEAKVEAAKRAAEARQDSIEAAEEAKEFARKAEERRAEAERRRKEEAAERARRDAERKKAEEKRKQEYCEDKFYAYTAAQDLIKKKLVSPSTAEFPGAHKVHIAYLGNCRHQIQGYVDSQNSFGAMIRTEYYAEVRYSKSDDAYFLDEFIVTS